MTAHGIDRRGFVKAAGLLAAGSVFGVSLPGCASFEYGPPIPCLSVVPPPAPEPGMKYIRASQIGCALDCDLRTGRNKLKDGPATDDGPRMNAAMAGASAINPITLIIDGSALISGLFMPAGGYWNIAGLGCGTGFYVKTGTNNDGIHNGPPDAAIPSDPGPPIPPRGSNVSLRNFVLNGNGGSGDDGDSTTGSTQGKLDVEWYYGINLMNLDNIVIENLAVVNAPSFHIRLSNVGNVSVSGCVLQSYGLNTDGVHFDGPANDISITNCNFTTFDDGIALNCPEGHGGNIERVSVSNCTFNSTCLMRLDAIEFTGSPAKYTIDTVNVTNCNGSLEYAGFFVGDGAGGNPNAVTNVTISDCNLNAPSVLDVGANFGNVTLNNVSLAAYSRSDSITTPGLAFLRTSKFLAGPNATYIGSNLILNNCAINRNSSVEVSAIIIENGSVIENVAFNGFSIIDKGSYPPVKELLQFPSGSIGQIVINALDSSNISVAATAAAFTNIGLVSGSGVLATNWGFPDSVMANEVPYISATTHLPSIKVNGIVEPYTL